MGYLSITVTAGACTASGATTATHAIPWVILAPVNAVNFIGGLTYTRGPVAGSPQVFVNITAHFVNLP